MPRQAGARKAALTDSQNSTQNKAQASLKPQISAKIKTMAKASSLEISPRINSVLGQLKLSAPSMPFWLLIRAKNLPKTSLEESLGLRHHQVRKSLSFPALYSKPIKFSVSISPREVGQLEI